MKGVESDPTSFDVARSVRYTMARALRNGAMGERRHVSRKRSWGILDAAPTRLWLEVQGYI